VSEASQKPPTAEQNVREQSVPAAGGGTDRSKSPRGRSKSPMRRPSFGRKSSRNNVAEASQLGGLAEASQTPEMAAGQVSSRKTSLGGGALRAAFGGLSRRNKSPTPRKD